MSFTDYEEQKILQYLYGAVSYTPPTIYYIGVSQTAISDAGTGATEPSGGNYARVAVPNISTAWTYAGNQISNGTTIQFPTPSASWGNIGYIFISDAPTGGNIRNAGSLTPQQNIDTGQAMQFAAGDVIITID